MWIFSDDWLLAEKKREIMSFSGFIVWYHSRLLLRYVWSQPCGKENWWLHMLNHNMFVCCKEQWAWRCIEDMKRSMVVFPLGLSNLQFSGLWSWSITFSFILSHKKSLSPFVLKCDDDGGGDGNDYQVPLRKTWWYTIELGRESFSNLQACRFSKGFQVPKVSV